jgi:hypothetical protein
MRSAVRLSAVSQGINKAIGATSFGVFFKANSLLSSSLNKLYTLKHNLSQRESSDELDDSKALAYSIAEFIDRIQKHNDNLLGNGSKDLDKYLVSVLSADAEFNTNFISYCR